MRFIGILTGYYDAYKGGSSGNYGLFHNLGVKMNNFGLGVYHILLMVAVYASGIAATVSAIMLVVATFKSGSQLSEAKSKIARTFFITVCIFAVSFIISLVLNASLD